MQFIFFCFDESSREAVLTADSIAALEDPYNNNPGDDLIELTEDIIIIVDFGKR